MLTLRATYEVLQAGRQRQQTAAFWQEYKLRAGMEGTVSALVRQHGARRTRYQGSIKTHVQSLLTAIAVNLRRTGSLAHGRASRDERDQPAYTAWLRRMDYRTPVEVPIA